MFSGTFRKRSGEKEKEKFSPKKPEAISLGSSSGDRMGEKLEGSTEFSWVEFEGRGVPPPLKFV
jgi:hypothetical protein